MDGVSDIGVEGGGEVGAEGEGCGRGLHVGEGDVGEMERGVLEHSRHGCHCAVVRWLVHERHSLGQRRTSVWLPGWQATLVGFIRR